VGIVEAELWKNVFVGLAIFVLLWVMKLISFQPFACGVSLADIRTLDSLRVIALGVNPGDAFGLSPSHPQIHIKARRL
jgi:hypothetical protein